MSKKGMLIIGGDLNDTLSSMDKILFLNKVKSPVFGLKQLIKPFKLLDIWRIKHPNLKQFTWKRKHNNREASRIDLFLIQPEINPLISSCDIRPAFIRYTDHLAISIKLSSNSNDRGPGTFKLNNGIFLENTDYQNLIENLITRFKNNINQYKDIGCAWDVFKNTVREKTINVCKSESQKRKSEIKVLEQKLKSLNVRKDNLCGDLENNVVKQKNYEIEENLENLFFVKARGAEIRSRVQWIEQGEKNTKYFLGLEKTRQTRKTINLLNDENGVISRQQTKILQLSKSYYENIYRSTNPNIEEVKTYIDNPKINKKLRMEESLINAGKLNIEECTNAIFKMRLNRSPGYDGITVEFYKQFWESLKDFIVPVFNYNYDRKELTQFQKLGMLTLIYNKNDPLSLSNYRPITLLNTDTKLIAYALAQRFKKVLPLIISNDQNGYIKKRCIGFNRNESGMFGALKSDSTHHFFRNACTKSGSLRFSQFSGC